MKRILIAVGAAAALAGAGNVAIAGGDHKPMKGGIVTPGKEADYELVARPEMPFLRSFEVSAVAR